MLLNRMIYVYVYRTSRGLAQPKKDSVVFGVYDAMIYYARFDTLRSVSIAPC